MLLRHSQLPLVGGAIAVDIGDRGKLVGTVQRLGDRLQPGQHIREVIGNQPLLSASKMITASRP